MFVRFKTKYGYEMSGDTRLMQYADGSNALVLSAGSMERLSINLSFYGLVPPEGHVYIKDWSEHEGLADALEAAGAVEKVAPVRVGQFNSLAWLVKVVE